MTDRDHALSGPWLEGYEAGTASLSVMSCPYLGQFQPKQLPWIEGWIAAEIDTWPAWTPRLELECFR